MDFDPSKENIQPLRGGRNANQLEVALNAQSSEDFQRELLQQKEQFENAIRNYTGEDPIDNWYQYISWVEQSYPKHGYEGNLVQLLEDCLTKFENDKQYSNDPRFCKLWIKYNDLQQNPLELYQMIYARGLCRGCAEFYRAWAFYHEAAADYRSADEVFQLGRRELAQPFEELILAHQQLVFAAGQQLISGVNEQRLLEERKALTTLRTYKPGKVDSVRAACSSATGMLASTFSVSRPNAVISVYEDKASVPRSAEAAPISILSAAKRQVARKENTIKAGTWTTAGSSLKLPNVQRNPKFAVHEDDLTETGGVLLPPGYTPITREDFSNWKPALCYPEPEDNARYPMYPKAKVYCTNETEFSIEEIRAARYLPRMNVSHVETEQAIQSILEEGASCADKSASQVHEQIYHEEVNFNNNLHQNIQLQQNVNLFQHNQHILFPTTQDDGVQPSCSNMCTTDLPDNTMHQSLQYNITQHEQFNAISQHEQFHTISQPCNESILSPQHSTYPNQDHATSRTFGQYLEENVVSPLHNPYVNHHESISNKDTPDSRNIVDVLWRSSNESPNVSLHEMKPSISKFSIYEETNNEELLSPKGSAMKTTPFKILSDEDLAETGSRGGHDIAAAAQPDDGARNIVILEDDSNSIPCTDLNSPYTTQIFNCNLNAMRVSTPYSKQNQSRTSAEGSKLLGSVCKQLILDEPEIKRMSTIFEETGKSDGSVPSSSSILKLPTLNNSKRENLAVITEESNSYHFNLAQNLKANAALRTSVLEVMDCESGQSSPVTETPIIPLLKAPSDPFRSKVLAMLLEHVNFPSRHSYGYINTTIPRLAVRKEITCIANDKYYIEKVLGKGTYGQVFKATEVQSYKVVALKYQKPANSWEFYICRELQCRLAKHPLKDCFMDVQKGYFSDKESVFVSEYSPSGSLLDTVNLFKTRTGSPIKQSLCVYFCIEMLKIISAMHKVKIIHADIKPDNFLVYIFSDSTIKLQLIDFGCSIDMSLFPPGTTFTRRITTKDFICCEMQDNRPWSYHTDLFCVASTAHVLLFDKYMQLQKNGHNWSITSRMNRYMRQDLWNEFFSRLLNQQSGPADPDELIDLMSDALSKWNVELNSEMRKLSNVLNNR